MQVDQNPKLHKSVRGTMWYFEKWMMSLILKVIREVEVMVVRCIGNEVLTSMCIAVTTGTKYPIGVLKGQMSAGQLKKIDPKNIPSGWELRIFLERLQQGLPCLIAGSG